MEKTYFGAHHDTLDLIKGAYDIKQFKGNLIQIFLTKDRKFKYYSKQELNNYRKYLDKNKMKCVVHSSYQHNLCRDWEPQSWWIKNILLEIEYAHLIGSIGLVIHFGNRMNLNLQEAYNNMFSSLAFIHDKTKDIKDVMILLETPAGQGSQICYQLDDLSYFYKKIKNSKDKLFKNRIKICLDTCHIFSAGYDIRNSKSVDRYLKAFEELIGLRYIKLIHLNDSKSDIGSLVDRHENIGKGYIGLNGLKLIGNYFMKLDIPIILETPNDGFKKEIKIFVL